MQIDSRHPSLEHPSHSSTSLEFYAEKGAQWAVFVDAGLTKDDIQASAGGVDGMTPRTSATATPMATPAWYWSMGASTKRILHTNLAR